MFPVVQQYSTVGGRILSEMFSCLENTFLYVVLSVYQQRTVIQAIDSEVRGGGVQRKLKYLLQTSAHCTPEAAQYPWYAHFTTNATHALLEFFLCTKPDKQLIVVYIKLFFSVSYNKCCTCKRSEFGPLQCSYCSLIYS